MRAGNIYIYIYIYDVFSRFCKKTKAAEATTDHVQCNLRGQILHPCDRIRFLASLGHQIFDSITLLAPPQARPYSADALLGPPLPSPPSFPRPPAQPPTPSLVQGCLGKSSAKPALWRSCRTSFPLRVVSLEKKSCILVRACMLYTL